MRRKAMAVTAAALVLGVSAAAGCGPQTAGPDGRAAANPHDAVAVAAAGTKTVGTKTVGAKAVGAKAVGTKAVGTKAVEYGGYAINVPAAWPVYQLSAQPQRCVRYDRHAVYLGTPGPDQQCPAHLVGRTETVQIDGGGAPAVAHQRGVALARANNVSAHRAIIVRDAQGRELGLTIRWPRLSIIATYANDPAVVERIISSVRGAGSAPVAPSGAGPTAPPPWLALAADRVASGRAAMEAFAALEPMRAPARVGVAAAGSVAAGSVAAGSVAAGSVAAGSVAARSVAARSVAAGSVAAGWAAAAAPTTRTAGTVIARARRARRPLAGFDTCTAPSIPAMRAWRSYYAAVGVYIGGANRACDAGNLSARWVRRVKAMGWSLIPAYVGRQPPCDRFSVKIKPRRAAREGAAAASDAVALARGLRLHRHAPIYFDMEAYNSASRKCRNAVLTFLDAWTRRLRARGYVPGVYASAASGAENLGGTTRIAGHRLARPQSIWFALWDGHVNLRGQPYLLATWWPRDRRIKQFRSNRWQKHGRFRLDIDRDEVFGAVY